MSNDPQKQPINICSNTEKWLPIPPEFQKIIEEAEASGHGRSSLVIRLIVFPCRIYNQLNTLAGWPDYAFIFPREVLNACAMEKEEIVRHLDTLLNITKPGKILLKEWKRLLKRTGQHLTSGYLRAVFGGGPIIKRSKTLQRLMEMEDETQMDYYFGDSKQSMWPTKKREAWFNRWLNATMKNLLMKWDDSFSKADIIWEDVIDNFGEVAKQISAVNNTTRSEFTVGQIQNRWKRAKKAAEKYLEDCPITEWPVSQNRFAKRIGVTSTTLRKAIDNSPEESLLRTWDSEKEIWKKNKKLTRSDDPLKPAVVSLEDVPEPESKHHDDSEDKEARQLAQCFSKEELIAQFKEIFEKVQKSDKTWADCEKLFKDQDLISIAKTLLLLKEQYQDTFDISVNTSFRKRRQL